MHESMHQLEGGCHCGTITVTYRTAIAPEATTPRACQCTFCRKHQTRAISDPAGRLEIVVRDPAGISRYRFGLGTADFLICRTCGVYVAAFMPDPDDAHGFATLMASALEPDVRFPDPVPAHYDAEDAAAKRARRRRMWTPAVLRSA